LGVDDAGKYRVVDVPRGEFSFSKSQLLTQWDGVILIAKNKGEDLRFDVLSARSGAVGLRLLWVWPSILGVVIAYLFRNRIGSNAVISIFTASLLGSVVFHQFLDPSSFFNSRSSVKHCIAKSAGISSYFGELTQTNERAALRDATVVDARPPQAYESGHWPNAVNFPVDASLAETQSAISEIPKDKEIVVYCQSSNCKWGQVVAARLRLFGFRKISIFVPGWDSLVDSSVES
jgi:rhodanese-related sulfurtransferase